MDAFKAWINSFLHLPEVLLSEQFLFGMREILVVSNKLDASALINAKMVHGDVDYKSAKNWPSAWKSPVSRFPILSWSKIQEDELRHLGFREKIINIGAPYLHLLKYILEEPELELPKTRKNSLLYFPNHTHPGVAASHKNEESLTKLREEYTTVTVCLFWLDFIDPEIYERYSKWGFEVVCVGYKGNTRYENPWSMDGGRVNFLVNLAEIIESHEYVLSDSPSTAFLYSAFQKKKVKFDSFNHQYVNSNFANSTTVFEDLYRPIIYQLQPQVWYDCSKADSQALFVATEILGYGHVGNFKNWIESDSQSLNKGRINPVYSRILQENIHKRFKSRKS